MKLISTLLNLFLVFTIFGQTWQDVGGGTNNSSHGLLNWNGQLVDLGSFNNPCGRVAVWDGTAWDCLGSVGVGIVARAGIVWNGNLVVVGDFWNNFQPCVGCNGIAMWDGTQWVPFGTGFNNDVLCLAVWDGNLIVGGDFTMADGQPSSRIVRWTGTTFESIGNLTSFDNDIRTMTVFEDELWVGGDFNNVDGCTACDGLVKWDGTQWVGGNSGVDLVGGVNESVRVLYVNPNDGNLYMGGEFPELIDGGAGVTDFNMSGVAMYDGSNWYPLGTGLNEYCRAIHEYNGDLIVGGYFTTAGGVPAQKIARWNTTTQTWSAMGGGFDGVGVDEYVKAATAWNETFFAGGAYTQAEGGPMNYIAQWDEPIDQAAIAEIWTSQNSACDNNCAVFMDFSQYNPTSWSWSFPGSYTPNSSIQHPGTICYPSSGTYNVSLQACNSLGCSTYNTTVTVTGGAGVNVDDAAICSGGSITLTATPSASGGTYLWSPGGETTQSITVSPVSSTTYTVQYTLGSCTGVDDAFVNVGGSIGVSVNNATICAGENATLTAIPTAGGGTYLWTPGGATTQSISVSPATTTIYTIDYTLGGCTGSNTGTVTVNDAPTISVNSPTICSGQSATLTATPSTGGGTYLWSTSETTQSISVNPATNSTYSVVYTLNSCSSSSEVSTVTVLTGYNLSENIAACEGIMITYPDGVQETITASTSHTSNLLSQEGCDSVIVTNVTMNPVYNSSENIDVCNGATVTYPDGFSETISSSTSHTSNLITVSGCDSVIVTNVTMISGYNMNENIAVCPNTTVTFPDGSTQVITGNTTYTSSLLSVSGCDSIIVTNVTMNPAYNINENIAVCEGTSVTYPDGFTEIVNNNTMHTSALNTVSGCDSIIVTNITVNPSFSSNEAISVCQGSTVTYPDGFAEIISSNTMHTSLLSSVNGCDSVIVTNVTMNSVYNSVQNLDVCSGSTYVYPDGTVSTNITSNESHASVLSSIGGCDSTIVTNLSIATTLNYAENIALCSGEDFTYPDGTVSVNIITNESHVSSLVSVNGCDSIITTSITVNPVPVLTVNSETICFGELVNLFANPSLAGGTYLWNPGGASSQTISVSPATTTSYNVVYTLNGCQSNSAISTVTVQVMPDVSLSTTINNVITVAEPGANYQWLDCDNGNAPIAGANTQSYTATANGSYAAEVVLNGCTDTSSCEIISTVGLEDVFQSKGIQIYPNPVSKTLRVDGNNIVGLNYKIIDVTGKVLTSGSLGKINQIDISDFTTGVYFIAINGKNYRFVKM